MSTIDANILLYAVNADSPRQAVSERLLRRLVAGPDLVTLFWPALMGFVQIATHSRVFARPLTLDAALSAVEALTAPPHVRVLAESDGFWPLFQDVAQSTRAKGKLVPDAHLVALMRQHGVREIWTHDRDFRKFDGIVVKEPTTEN